jgi:membrane protein DedA with SNARE-associated domain
LLPQGQRDVPVQPVFPQGHELQNRWTPGNFPGPQAMHTFMDTLSDFFADHGVATVFIVVLLEQLGAPLPAVPFLLLAGAEGVADPGFLVRAFVAASVASVIADYVWYLAGRRWGRVLLGFLCRVSSSPEGCVSRSETAFARRRALTLVASKFVPGISTIAPPLAGAVGMRTRTFLSIDLAASALWSATGLALGFAFDAEVGRVLRVLQEWGSAALLSLLAALAAWLAWRAGRRRLTARLLAALRSRPEILSFLGAVLEPLPRRRGLRCLACRALRRAGHGGSRWPCATPAAAKGA